MSQVVYGKYVVDEILIDESTQTKVELFYGVNKHPCVRLHRHGQSRPDKVHRFRSEDDREQGIADLLWAVSKQHHKRRQRVIDGMLRVAVAA